METNKPDRGRRYLTMGSRRESVLFVVNNIPEQEGRTRYQHAASLCESFETTILCAGDVPAPLKRNANEVHMYPNSFWSAFALMFPLWILFWTVRVRARVTVVAPHSLYVLVTYVGARVSSSRHVIDFWDDLSLPVASYRRRKGLANRLKTAYHRTLYWAAQPCLRRTDLLILSIHPGLVKKYDLSSVPLLELTNGYNPCLLSVKVDSTEDNSVRFIYLGQANAKRGIDAVIRTVASAVPEAYIDIVGQTDTPVELVAEQHDNVFLHGERPYREALELVAHADVGLCVLDTTVENYRYSYPIKIFEYAALGKAIVVSDTHGIRSLLTAGESALLVDHNSEDQLRDAVTTIATNEEFRRTLGQNARDEILEYSWPNVLEQYTAVIQEQMTRDLG